MANQGFTLIKRFTYRGAPEEFSNLYHFSNTAPSTPAAWKTLVDAVAAKEKLIYPSSVKIVRAYCYTDTNNDAVATVDYTALGAEIPGTLATTGQTQCPGDAAVWIRWGTAKKNSKGKTVYLRKYFHPAFIDTGVPDTVSITQNAALQGFGNACNGTAGPITGFTLCGPDGTAAGTATAAQFVTTRTLKRRGKRPPT
jgi:hypothetical protein